MPESTCYCEQCPLVRMGVVPSRGTIRETRYYRILINKAVLILSHAEMLQGLRLGKWVQRHETLQARIRSTGDV